LKSVVGIDREGTYRGALDLALGLGFANEEIHLLHCVPSVPPEELFADAAGDHPIPALLGQWIEDGNRELSQAEQVVRAAGPPTVRKLTFGHAAGELIRYADAVGADLVVAGSTRRDAPIAFRLGSVGRALAIGAQQSILVAKGDRKGAPIRAVFATDHSEYAGRCLDKFIALAPRGLAHVTVMTADRDRDGLPVRFLPPEGSAQQTMARVHERLFESNGRVARRLAEAGIEAEPRVFEGIPDEAIRRAMEETGSNLLILGARGHGLFERLAIGSTSLHQVMVEPHSVLVLRT
jgi:nucleotide-binding universal stress UspA family protein